jgi:hypothetical protein
MSAHTPGPWQLGEYDEHLGYDCMTGGIRVGNICLDGADYGQKRCTPIEPDALQRMTSDARLIAAAPALLSIAQMVIEEYESKDGADWQSVYKEAKKVVARVEGEQS